MKKNNFKKIVLYNFIFIFLILILFEFSLKVFTIKNVHFTGRILEYTNYNLEILTPNKVSLHQYNKYKASYKTGDFYNRSSSIDNVTSNRKVLILGDSWTFGWLLNEEFTINYELSKKYPEYHFINASTPGHGLSSNLLFLKMFCEIINPEKIILILNYPSIERALKSGLFKLKNGNLVQGNKSVNPLKKKLSNSYTYNLLINNLRTLQLIRYIYYVKFPKMNNRFNFSKNSDVKDEILIIDLMIKKIVKEVKKCNSNIVFIYNGWYDLNDKNNFLIKTIEYLNKTKVFKENDLLLHDASKDLKIISSNMNKYQISTNDDKHPNKEGARIKNKAIIKILEKYF